MSCQDCHEDLSEFPELNGICDECRDARCKISLGRFHDPDLLVRDAEEGGAQ
jgi:Zn finger protein HypA/HybF involved in hydrogenase expression